MPWQFLDDTWENNTDAENKLSQTETIDCLPLHQPSTLYEAKENCEIVANQKIFVENNFMKNDIQKKTTFEKQDSFDELIANFLEEPDF